MGSSPFQLMLTGTLLDGLGRRRRCSLLLIRHGGNAEFIVKDIDDVEECPVIQEEPLE